jgi:hypothetical protein
MKRLIQLAFVVTFCSGLMAAQQNPVSDAVRQSLQRFQKIIVAAAGEMPADKYSYSPTPAQVKFGQLMAHISGSNYFLCSRISGEKPPANARIQASAGKDKLVDALKASFQYCSDSLAKVDDSKLSEQVPFFGGRQISRAAAMINLTDDWADHYGTAAGYLRLNGLLPPTARH